MVRSHFFKQNLQVAAQCPGETNFPILNLVHTSLRGLPPGFFPFCFLVIEVAMVLETLSWVVFEIMSSSLSLSDDIFSETSVDASNDMFIGPT